MALCVEAHPARGDGTAPGFEASSAWTGARPGWCFKTGTLGLGYYLDCSDEELENRLRGTKGPVDHSALFVLAHRERIQRIATLLVADPDLWNARQEDGVTILHWAASAGDDALVEQAFSVGMIPADTSTSSLQTPLMWAAATGRVSTMRLLLDAGVDPYRKDAEGRTPLFYAVQHKKLTAFLLLVALTEEARRTAFVNDVDSERRSVSHWAAAVGDVSALKLLEHFGANLMRTDSGRNTPLHRAAENAQTATVQYLVEQGVDATLPNGDGITCIDLVRNTEDQDNRKALERALRPAGVGADLGDCAEALRDLEDGPRRRSASKQDEAASESMRKMFAGYGFMIGWTVCVSFTVFQYLSDCRQVVIERMPHLAAAFELGVGISLVVFVRVATLDPGRVPANAMGKTAAVEAMLQLLRDGKAEIDGTRLCTTTWILKAMRTKYCSRSRFCVREFDHFCDITNGAIGEGNHRLFLILLFVEPITQLLHWAIMCLAASYTIGFPTGILSFPRWMLEAALVYPLMFFGGVMHSCTLPMLIPNMILQFSCISLNLTVNEMTNQRRYDHIWEHDARGQKQLRSPFDKGGFFWNWHDFWIRRTRAEVGPMCPKKTRATVNELVRAGAQ